MANSVDEKVVQLTLENKQFESASDESIKTLDDLKKALEFEGSIEAFDKLDKEVKKVDFEPMNKGVQAVANQFNALHTIADAALRNITNRAISAGENLVKSLSTDQIMAGWNKFGEKTRSVGTLVSQGFNLDTVNEQLERLTWFTDETSYNFTDMVSNISKFTASGKGLEESNTAMQGIALWAAMAGQNAGTASRAMYQLSQAMGSGVMKRMDWQSIVNANMDTAEFRQKALDAGVALGTLVKNADGTYQSLMAKADAFTQSQFIDSLTEGLWFTDDVMMKVFGDYSAAVDQLYEYASEKGITASQAIEELGGSVDEFGLKAFLAGQEARTFEDAIDSVKDAVSSKWMDTFAAIFGDYDEAKVLWTDLANALYDVFAASGDTRNEILALWKAAGGRDTLIDAFKELGTSILDIISIFTEPWGEVFGGTVEELADRLLDFTEKFRDFAEAIRPTEDSFSALKDILTAVFTTLKTGVNIVRAFATGLSPIAKLLNTIAGVVLQLAASFARLTTAGLEKVFNEERLTKFATALNAVSSIISGVLQVGLGLLLALIDKISLSVGGLFEAFQNSSGGIAGIFEVLTGVVQNFFESFSNGETIANKVVNGILAIFGGLIIGVRAVINTIVGLFTGEMDSEKILGGKNFSEAFKNLEMDDKITKVLEKLKEFSGYISSFVGDLSTLEFSLVELVRMVGESFDFLYNKFKTLIDSITIDDIKDILLLVILFNFTNSLKTLNKSLSTAVTSIGGTFGALTTILKDFSGNNTAIDKINTLFNKTKILQLGVSVVLIVTALSELNKLDYERTLESIAMLGTTLALLLVVVKKLSEIMTAMPKKEESEDGKDKIEVANSFAFRMLEFSASLLLVAKALKNVNTAFTEGGHPWQALGVVTILIAEMTAVSVALQKFEVKKIGGALTSMIGIAASVYILSKTLAPLTEFKYEKLQQAVEAVTVLIAALGVSVFAMSKTDWKIGLTLVPAMLGFVSAMVVLVTTFAVLAQIQMPNITSALAAFGTAVLSMGLAIGVLGVVLKETPASVILSIGAAFDLFALSMIGLATAVLMLQDIDWERVKVGVAIVGGAIAIFGALVAALTLLNAAAVPVVTALDMATNAFMKFSLALLAISAAVGILAGVSAIFATIIAAFQALAEKVGIDLPALISSGFDTLELIIREFLEMLRNLAPDILATMVTLFGLIVLAIEANRHKTATAVILTGIAIAEAIKEWGPELLDALVTILKFIEGADELFDTLEDLAQKLGEVLGSALVRAICGVLSGVVDGVVACFDYWFGSAEQDITNVMNDSLQDAIAAVGDTSLDEETRKVAYNQIKQIMAGYEEGSVELNETMAEVGRNAAEEYKDAFEEKTEINSPSGMAIDEMGYIADGYVVGAEENAGKIQEAGRMNAENIAQGTVDGLASSQTDVNNAVTNSIGEAANVAADSVSNASGTIAEAAKKVANETVDGALNAVESSSGDTAKKTGGIWQTILDVAGSYVDTSALENMFNLNNYVKLPTFLTGSNSTLKKYQQQLEATKTLSPFEEMVQLEKDQQAYIKKTYTEAGETAGNSWTDGLTSAATSSSSKSKATTAAKSQADLIAEEFADEIDKINRENETEEKLYKLWSAQNPAAGQLEKSAKEIERQTKAVQTQTELANIASQKYEKTVAAYGETSKEAHDAYMDMLDAQIAVAEAQEKLNQSQIELTKQQTELADAQKDLMDAMKDLYYEQDAYQDDWYSRTSEGSAEARRNAFADVKEVYNSWRPFYDMVSDQVGGINDDMLMMAASVEAGVRNIEEFDAASANMIRSLQAKFRYLGNLYEDVEDYFGEEMYEDMMAAAPRFDDLWKDIMLTISGNAVGFFATGILDNSGVMADTFNQLGADLNDKFYASSSNFGQAGLYFDQGLAEGILSNQSIIAQAGESAAMKAYEAACAALEIYSPSRVMLGVGRYFDLGLANGITDYGYQVENSTRGMIDDITSASARGLDGSRDEINRYLQRMFDVDAEQLGMTVIVDMDTTPAQERMSELERAYSIAQSSQLQANVGGVIATDINDTGLTEYTKKLMEEEAYRSKQLQRIYDLIEDYTKPMSGETGLTEGSDKGSTNINYTQNNYSPKSLSRTEIYRDTQRQLNAFAAKFSLSNKR